MTSQFVCTDTTRNGSFVTDENIPTCRKFMSVWDESTANSFGYERVFASAAASKIVGSDASMTGQIPVNQATMPVFISDIYRSCELQYQSTVNDFYSLPLRRYVLDNGDMESAANVPSQSDYYQFGVRGLENMSKVAGFPLFASKPHFLDGDISLIENIDGVTPERNLHETFVDYEINTGVAMRAAKRLQVNTLLEDWDLPTFVCGEPEIMKLLNLTALCGCLSVEVDWGGMGGETFLPLMWTSESYSYTEDDANDVSDSIVNTKAFATEMVVVLGGAGLFVLFVCIPTMLCYGRRVKGEVLN